MPQTADPAAQQRERDLNSLYRIGLFATLAFVTVTFVALALVFVIRSRVPENWSPILLPPILWADTALLLASSVTFAIARRRLQDGRQDQFFRWNAITLALAVLFLAGQVVAWLQILAAGQPVTNDPHSTFFFLFSGLHGAHILAGLAGFITLFIRTRRPASGPKWQMHTRVFANALSIFWHYLDALWIVLFAMLLIIKR